MELVTEGKILVGDKVRLKLDYSVDAVVRRSTWVCSR